MRLSVLILLVACKAAVPTPAEEELPPPEETAGVLKASSRGSVRFKRAARLANDYAQALDLSADELCKELGQYECARYVHAVALGAPEPYNLGLYEALPETGASTPIVVDRIALSACTKRATADFAAPAAAVLWKGGDTTAEVTALYERALQRRPTDAEVARFLELQTQVTTPRDFAILACFVVLTTSEALFY